MPQPKVLQYMLGSLPKKKGRLCRKNHLFHLEVCFFRTSSSYRKQNTFYNRKCFPEYPGQDEYDQALEYIQFKFDQMIENSDRVSFLFSACTYPMKSFQLVYRYVISTIDTENVRLVM